MRLALPAGEGRWCMGGFPCYFEVGCFVVRSCLTAWLVFGSRQGPAGRIGTRAETSIRALREVPQSAARVPRMYADLSASICHGRQASRQPKPSGIGPEHAQLMRSKADNDASRMKKRSIRPLTIRPSSCAACWNGKRVQQMRRHMFHEQPRRRPLWQLGAGMRFSAVQTAVGIGGRYP